jgi:ligand-binding sensor domain-containing protein/two-component sensor histidine kinase
VLQADGAGGVWCGTITARDGLYHLGSNDGAFRHVDLPMTIASVTALRRDRQGTLWVGSPDGLYRLDGGGGGTRVFNVADGLPNGFIMALLEDRGGHLWIGTRKGLARLNSVSRPRSGQGPDLSTFGVRDGLPSGRIESLIETADGVLWAGTAEGLAERVSRRALNGREFQSYRLAQGLSAHSVGALAEDRDGNLWIGTFGSGAMKVARNGFTTYGEDDGASYIGALFESRDGAMCIVSRPENALSIARFENGRFVHFRPAWPPGLTYFGWGRGQVAVQDQTGDWWIATGHGAYRFARTSRVEELAGLRPAAIYTARDGLPGDNIYRVFPDSSGHVWIGTIGPLEEDGLVQWDRATGKLRAFGKAEGLTKPAPTAFAEDRAGGIWIGFYHGGLARYRNGRFDLFGEAEGIDSPVNTLFLDSAGRLWIGCALGLLRVDEPAQSRPRFQRYGHADGLASEYIGALTEDRLGRVYAATGRGIDRFAPQSTGLGPIRHYTTSDGVVPGEIDLAHCDRDGNLWFGSPLGLSRLVPTPDRAGASPPVLITGVSTGGLPRPISDLGESAVENLRVGRMPMRIDFVGLGFSPGETLRYQYRLEGDEAGWSPPTDHRSVIYASLSPGSYRFLVRVVTSDDSTSLQPASIAFSVLPPLWRTWWFLAASGFALGLAMYGLHRYRLKQLLAVAEVRARIATDLHDDIGASLSQIAILSELAQREGSVAEARRKTPLAEIAGISRQLVDSMSDIVWAIAPEHDRLTNLVYRMRRFAADLLGAHGIVLQFRSTVADRDLKIGADVRRQLYLIFKEAIHNIVRHSGAARVEVDLNRQGSYLYLSLADDGRGFDPTVEYEGRGLRSMQSRAGALGGKVRWESSPGAGSRVWITVRLAPVKPLSALRGK